MRRILIIDDDPLTLAILSEFLTEKYEVETVHSYAEASVSHQNKPFDLIITDLVMPEVDGLEVIEKFKQENVFLPVIAISSQRICNDTCLNLPVSIGADQFLEKPVVKDELISTIEHLLAKEDRRKNLVDQN